MNIQVVLNGSFEIICKIICNVKKKSMFFCNKNQIRESIDL